MSTRALRHLLLFVLGALGFINMTKAQTVRVDNNTAQPFQVYMFHSLTCASGGILEPCVDLAAYTTWVYSPPTGYVWRSAKILCGACGSWSSGTALVYCAGGTTTLTCGSTTYTVANDATHIRIY